MIVLMTLKYEYDISIYVPPRGVTLQSILLLGRKCNFNPHSPEGSDNKIAHTFLYSPNYSNRFTQYFTNSSLTNPFFTPISLILHGYSSANLPEFFCILGIRTNLFTKLVHHPPPSLVQLLYFPLLSYMHSPNNKISDYLSFHQ